MDHLQHELIKDDSVIGSRMNRIFMSYKLINTFEINKSFLFRQVNNIR